MCVHVPGDRTEKNMEQYSGLSFEEICNPDLDEEVNLASVICGQAIRFPDHIGRLHTRTIECVENIWIK